MNKSTNLCAIYKAFNCYMYSLKCKQLKTLPFTNLALLFSHAVQPEEEDSTTSEEEEEHKGDPVDEQQKDEEPPEIDVPLDFMDQDGDQLVEAAEEDGSPDPLMF